MSQQTAFFPFSGGLDMTTPAIATKSGTARLALNYEATISGYRRISGYERFDGRTSPTDAYLAAAAGSEQTAMDAARAAITAVPGSGPVRGVWVYNDNVYAFRDNVGGTAGVMHKATVAGWSAVTLPKTVAFTSGGTYEIVEGDVITGATSGATATVRRVFVTSGTWAAGTAAGTLVLSGQTGNFTGENLNVAANLNVATIAGNSAQTTLPAGGKYEFINHNFYGASNRYRMYGCNGVGKAFEFDGTSLILISTGMVTDTPHRIAAHKNHLFLAFTGGSLQHSAIGDPHDWSPTTGAAELAMGSEITDLIMATTSNLAIMCANKIAILYGNDSTDWQLETLTDEAGCVPWSADKIGAVTYLDARGVRQINTSQAYGNFRVGTITQGVHSWLMAKKVSEIVPTASCRVRTKDIYRLFFSDNTVLSIHLGKKNPEPMILDLGILVNCIVSADNQDGEELIYFGSDDGFVYQMDKGRSFDGDAVTFYLRLPFNHLGAPQVLKRWHKAEIECTAAPTTTIGITGDVDYADPEEPSLPSQELSVSGGGGFWDAVNWDEFYWSSAAEGVASAYLDVVGKNLSLLVVGETADEDPHLLQGVTLFYSVRGLRR